MNPNGVSYYCLRHPDAGWRPFPCQEPECRADRFTRFLRELVGLPPEKIGDKERESESGAP
jgi:hypothetical protein